MSEEKNINTNIPKGDRDLVCEYLSKIVIEASVLIEGKFMDAFEVEFELDGQQYKISMAKLKPTQP